MDLEVSTRLALATDAERIAKLLDAFRIERGHSAQTSISLPADSQGPLYVVVAQVEDHFVGIASLQRCHSVVDGAAFLLLTDIYVLDDYRRHGVATALLNEAISLGRRNGCQRFTMIVKESDEATLATAARTGFAKHPDLLLDLRLG